MPTLRVSFHIYACDVCGIVRMVPVAKQPEPLEHMACGVVQETVCIERDACAGTVEFIGSADLQTHLKET